MHDFFVLASCGIFVRLSCEKDKMSASAKDQKSIDINATSVKVPKAILPGNEKVCTQVLNRFGLDRDGNSNRAVIKLRKTCIPKCASFEDFLQASKIKSSVDKSNIKNVYDCIF